MSSEADTLPTLQTILSELREFRAATERRFDGIEHQLTQMDIRLDRLEGQIDKTHSEVMYLRADFKAFRSQVVGATEITVRDSSVTPSKRRQRKRA